MKALPALRLAHKIGAIGAVGVIGALALGGIVFVGEQQQAQHRQTSAGATALSQLGQGVSTDLLQARRMETEFLLRPEERNIQHHSSLVASAMRRLESMKQQAAAAQLRELVGKVEIIQPKVETYTEYFRTLSDAQKKLGFDENSGVGGLLRASVRGVEELLEKEAAPRLQAGMLLMRRHEKDFMLTRDTKYAEEFKDSVLAYADLVEVATIPPSVKKAIIEKTSAYQRSFLTWATGASTIHEQQTLMSEIYAEIETELKAMLDIVQRVYQQAEAAEVSARANTDRQIHIAVLLVVLVVGALAFLIGRSVARPLKAMTTAMRELASGNLDVVVPAAGRRDEVGEMAQALDVFKANAVERQRLQAEQRQIEERATAERSAQMHQLAGSFEAAVGNIIDTVASAAGQLETAATTLTGTAQQTQELSTLVAGASEEASANVQSVASATDQLATSVQEISRQVQESSTIASDAVRQAQATDRRIAELSVAASRIGDVVKMITAIAEQTNLLALNATIEAARAGDAGRGFAVVAQEVKALAAQTAKATDEIGSQITSMQSATRESVADIKEIGATIGRISTIAASVAAAVEQQGAATQEIARNVQQAAHGTAQAAQNMAEVSRGANETGSASAQVLASAQSLSREGTSLRAEVDRFLSTVRAA
jgi:methyl-accepting chemotaxis protein